MLLNSFDQILISDSSSLMEAMQKINENCLGVVFITKDEKIIGSLTDGDIRRTILDGGDIDKVVTESMNKSPIIFNDHKLDEQIDRIKPDFARIIVPVTSLGGNILDFLSLSAGGKVISLNKNPANFKDNRAVKSIAIVGGAGYLGSVLSKQLLEKGYKVIVLDNLLYGSHGIHNISSHNFRHIDGSMEKVSDIIETVREADAVVHLGAIVGDPASAISPSKTLSINLHSTKLVADICKFYNINRMIFASTCSVYGKSDGNEGITEEAPMNPVSLYARTKIESEKILLSMADGVFSPSILRFSTLFGLSDRMRFDLVVNILCAKAFFEKKITVFGGQQFRPLLSTHDASRSIISVLESDLSKVSGEVFNVGNTNLNYKIIEIGQIIKEKLPDANLEITENDEDIRDYNVSFDKIQNMLNFEVECDLEHGIDEIIEEFKNGKFEDYLDKKYSNYLSLTD